MVSDEALYEALLRGELRAFDALYERYERPLFGFIHRYLKDAHESEDVLHEAFLAVLRGRAEARPSWSFRAWIFQVARRLCMNRQRSRHRASRAIEGHASAPAEPPPHPEHALAERQRRDVLRDAVASLPLELAELYQLRSSGLSYEEMADVLGIPLGTVKSRMHQMVARLREEFSQ